jgi:hypothetical protein
MARYKLSLSVTQDTVAEYHSRRTYTPASAEASLADRNVHIYNPRHDNGSLITYHEQFNQIFADSIQRYNAKQKRQSRHMSEDYWETIESSKRKEKPVYSTVLQIGNRDTCGVTDVLFDAKHWRKLKEKNPDEAAAYVQEHLDPRPQHDAAVACLIDIAERFKTWYPRLHIVSMVLHDDEVDGTPHVDLNWVPVAGGEGEDTYKGGMDTRCALNKALEQMGFDGRGYDYRIKHWQTDFKARCESVMAEHDIEREYMNNEEKHQNIRTYRIEQEREEAADRLREIKRRQEVARVTLEKLELDIETAKHRKRATEADELSAKERARQAEDEARAAEAKARQAEAQATEAETRQRIADAAVVAARKRQDDAERELQRNAERYKAARAKTDEAEAQAQAAEGKISQLTDWIHRLSDIKSLVTTVLSGVVSYIDTVHTEEARVAGRFMRTHATGIISYTAKAVKLKVEEIVTGKKVIDDSTKREPVRTIHIPTNTRRPPQDTPTV